MIMNPKRMVELAHKLVVLNFLIQELLDELNPRTAEIKEYRENLLKLTEMLNNEIADTEAIQSTLYFQDLSNKVDTIIRKNLNTEL